MDRQVSGKMAISKLGGAAGRFAGARKESAIIRTFAQGFILLASVLSAGQVYACSLRSRTSSEVSP